MNEDELLAIQEAEDFDWSIFGDLEDPRPHYENSCPFNIHLVSSDARFTVVVKQLCIEIGYELDRAVYHMGMVILNLYKANKLDPKRWTGYSRGTGNYKFIFRYNRLRITYRPLMKVIDGLIEKGYVEPLSFSYNSKTGKGRCSRIRANDKLIKLLEAQQFTEEMIQLHKYEEVIILKDDTNDKKVIDYVDNEVTDAMRSQVQRYNVYLQVTVQNNYFLFFEKSS